MNFKLIFLITNLVILFFDGVALSQDSRIFADNYYLHTDRDMYVAGEEIKFKIYPNSIIASKYELSKFIYLSIVTNKGEIIRKAKIKKINNCAYGSIQIPDNIESQYLWLYIYSKWQRNFSEGNYCRKKIFSINSKKGINYSNEEIKNKNIKFYMFPENNRLISGFKNKVVFYCINEFDEVVPVSGKIVDNTEVDVCNFSSGENKIGCFNIKPVKGRKYKAKIWFNEKLFEFDLPEIFEEAFTYSIDNSNNDYVLIERGIVQKYTNKQEVVVNILHNGIEYMSFIDDKLDKDFRLKIQKEQMIPGINQIAITDLDGVTLFSRTISVNSTKTMKVHIKTDKDKYMTRELVTVNLNTLIHQTPQKLANLSVSVTRIDNTTDYTTYSLLSDIKTNMFYNSEFIELFRPAKIDENFDKDFENFLITKNIPLAKSGLKINYFPEVYNSYLEGNLNKGGINSKSDKDNIVLTVLDSINSTYVVMANRNGQFIFVVDEDLNSNEILIQTLDSIKDINIKINDNYENELKMIDYGKPLLNEKKIKTIKQLIFNYQINKQFEKLIEENLNSSIKNKEMFYGFPDSTYVLDKYIALPTTEEVFHNLITNVSVKKKKNKYSFLIFDKKKKPLQFSPLVMVDGIPLADNNILFRIPPSKIERIEVIMRNYLIGENIFGGIISVISKDKDYAGIKLDKSAKMFSFQPTQGSNHVVDDKEEELNHKNIPNLRNTIYWNPEIKTNIDGKAQFQFFTTDETGKFVISIEGISKNGIPGKGYYIYEVKTKSN